MALPTIELPEQEHQLILKNTFLQVRDKVGQAVSARPRASSVGCTTMHKEANARDAEKAKSSGVASDDETDAPSTEFPETDDESSFSKEIVDVDFERTARENVRLLRDCLSKSKRGTNCAGGNSGSGGGGGSSSSSSICGAYPMPMQVLGANPFLGASAMMQPLIFVMDTRVQAHSGHDNASHKRKQRSKASQKSDQQNTHDDKRTTVMLRNLPREFSRDMLLKLLDDHGFNAKYNFVYMPLDFVRSAGLGYAFINLVSADVVPDFWKAFDGLSIFPIPCDKVCRVNWSSPHQGFDEHVQRYRNSPLMHQDVPDECRPVLLENGVRVAFPPPTKSLRAPRLRASRQRCAFWDQEQAQVAEDEFHVEADEE